MGGLSSDPAKAQRQRDALAAGRRKMAENTLASQGKPKPKPAAKAPAKPKAKAAAKASKSTPRRAADPDRVTYKDDRRGPAPRTREPRREDREPKRRGFLDGLLGRID